MFNPFKRKYPAFPNPPNTPDLPVLENAPKHYVFHYGDPFRREECCDAFTDQNMIMWMDRTRMGAQPIALQLKVDRQYPRGKIYGRLYRLSADDVIYLDRHMQNGVVFQRKLIKLRLPYDSQTRNGDYRHYTDFRAWAYLGKKEYWEERMEWDIKFHYNRGQVGFIPADHNIAGRGHNTTDGWVRRFYFFERRKPDPVECKSFLYFKGSRRYPEPLAPEERAIHNNPPRPGDEYRLY